MARTTEVSVNPHVDDTSDEDSGADTTGTPRVTAKLVNSGNGSAKRGDREDATVRGRPLGLGDALHMQSKVLERQRTHTEDLREVLDEMNEKLAQLEEADQRLTAYIEAEQARMKTAKAPADRMDAPKAKTSFSPIGY